MFKRAVLISSIKGKERFLKLGSEDLYEQLEQRAISWVKDILSAEGKEQVELVINDASKPVTECGLGYILKRADNAVEIWFNEEKTSWGLSKYTEGVKIGTFYVKGVEEADEELHKALRSVNHQECYNYNLEKKVAELEETKADLRKQIKELKEQLNSSIIITQKTTTVKNDVEDEKYTKYNSMLKELGTVLLRRPRSFDNCESRDVQHDVQHNVQHEEADEEDPKSRLRKLLHMSC